jgi:hypothetical protein
VCAAGGSQGRQCGSGGKAALCTGLPVTQKGCAAIGVFALGCSLIHFPLMEHQGLDTRGRCILLALRRPGHLQHRVGSSQLAIWGLCLSLPTGVFKPLLSFKSDGRNCACMPALTRMLLCADVGAGDVESRYTKEYEEALNPFTDFRDRERSARKRQLSPVDRMLYEIGQIVSGSKWVTYPFMPPEVTSIREMSRLRCTLLIQQLGCSYASFLYLHSSCHFSASSIAWKRNYLLCKSLSHCAFSSLSVKDANSHPECCPVSEVILMLQNLLTFTQGDFWRSLCLDV